MLLFIFTQAVAIFAMTFSPKSDIHWVWPALGYAGQALFFGRFFVQWLASERAKKSTVPLAFWFFSLGGSSLVLIYGIAQNDPVLIIGQTIGLLIYLRNLQLLLHPKKDAGDVRPAKHAILELLLVLAAALLILGIPKLANDALKNPDIPMWMLVIGLVGQTLFTGRFIVQWIASERAKKSTMPISFWILSLMGGSMLLTYAILRVDPVQIIGQGPGFFIYLRNLHLILYPKNNQEPPSAVVTDAAPAGATVNA